MKKIKELLSYSGSLLAKNKGSVSLFTIMLVVTLISAAIASLCGASELTKVVMAVSVSVMALIGLNSIEEIIGMRLGDNKRPAILGIIIGAWIVLI